MKTAAIGAGRLSRIAEALEVLASFFFPDESPAASPAWDQDSSPFALLSTSGAIHLVRAYARIQDGNARHALIEIAEHLAGTNVQRAKKGRKG